MMTNESNKTFQIKERINTIQIITALDEIKIEPSEDGSYGVFYHDEPFYDTTYTVENGKIYLEQKLIKRYFLLHPMQQFSLPPMVVKIPKAFDGVLDVTTSNIGISSNITNAMESVHYKTTNHSLMLENLTAKAIEIETSNAAVEIKNIRVSKGNFSVITSNDKIIASDIVAAKISFTTRNGGCEIEACEASELLRIRTSNSKILLTKSTAPSCELVTSNAGITVDECSSDVYNVNTSNAPVSMLLQGAAKDYDFTALTSDGSVTFGNVSCQRDLRVPVKSEKRINIKTSNSSIRVKFL